MKTGTKRALQRTVGADAAAMLASTAPIEGMILLRQPK